MKKYKMISVNEETYSKIRKVQDEMNNQDIVKYSIGSIILLGLEALKEKEVCTTTTPNGKGYGQ